MFNTDLDDSKREKKAQDLGKLPAFKWASVYRALRPSSGPLATVERDAWTFTIGRSAKLSDKSISRREMAIVMKGNTNSGTEN